MTTNKFRIIVTVKAGANPELHDELLKSPREDRSERIRHLASIGLMVVNGTITGVTGAVATEPKEAQTEASDDAARLGNKQVESGVLAGFEGGGWTEGEG